MSDSKKNYKLLDTKSVSCRENTSFDTMERNNMPRSGPHQCRIAVQLSCDDLFRLEIHKY